MASDRPNATELIETVRELLQDKLLPTMTGHGAFEVRIAANLLAIVLRELVHEPAAAKAERARLVALLGLDGSTEQLETELVRRIRAGELSVDDEALRTHLRESVRDRLAVANPKYLARG
jgi:hypothetical protein